MSYRSTWCELLCPKCNKDNFINAGDTQDLTGCDPEGCKCWNCGHCFDFEGEPIDEDECDLGKNLIDVKKLSDKLYDADPNCNHEIVPQMSGVKCTKCNGWFCS